MDRKNNKTHGKQKQNNNNNKQTLKTMNKQNWEKKTDMGKKWNTVKHTKHIKQTKHLQHENDGKGQQQKQQHNPIKNYNNQNKPKIQ